MTSSTRPPATPSPTTRARRLLLPAALAAALLAACSSGSATEGAGRSSDLAAVSSSPPSSSSAASVDAVRSSSTARSAVRATASRSLSPTRTRTSSGSAATRTATPQATAAHLQTATTGVSWNPHVTCRPVVTTLRTVLGTQRNASGGATFAGGGFAPGIPDRRSTNPPCSVSGKPTLVELHGVVMGSCSKINNDGDWTCELTDPAIPTSAGADMRQIHCEIDGQYRAKGWAPAPPPGGKRLDVQGFVFWDPGHDTAAWHHHSGWELHSFTAWRLAA